MSSQTPYLYPLFEHMSREHGLTLVDSELEEICDVVHRLPAGPGVEPAQAPKISPIVGKLRDGIVMGSRPAEGIGGTIIYYNLEGTAALMAQAAAEIERLRAALAGLMPFILEDIEPEIDLDHMMPGYRPAVEAAKAALENQP